MKKLLDYSKPDAVQMFTAEALETHKHFDRLGVPREHNGERLTISQRAKMLADTVRPETKVVGCPDFY